jgi:Zn-dependent protease with chaperone function
MAGLMALAVPLPAIAASGSPKASEWSLDALRAADVRVLSVGYRLATANAPFCRAIENAAGMTLHHIGQYPDAAAARATFGFAGDYAVLALVADGPAARAGLRTDDAIVSLNGMPLAPPAAELAAIDQVAAYRPIAWADTRMRAALDKGPVVLGILRGGQPMAITVTGTPACRSRFELRPSDSYGASADGDIVGITVPMLSFMADDDELAAILAHELAHNLLEHRRRLNEAGVQRGLLQQLGRNARLTLATEIEADRLSVWLMANAGYDPQASVRFWTRYGKQRGKGIFSAPTHYRWKKRVGLFEAEIAKMQAAARDAPGWYPPLLAKPTAPLE